MKAKERGEKVKERKRANKKNCAEENDVECK